jgi:integrase/recombinase XerD
MGWHMSKIKESVLFFHFVRDFLFICLREQEYKSTNTIVAYQQGLNSFRLFMKAEHEKGVDKVTFEMVTADMIREYLKWLVDQKGCMLTTRNHRLTCLKRYMQYCTERDVSLAQTYISVSKVKHITVRAKKGAWMTRDAVKSILEQPPRTLRGTRDRLFMIFLYSTGARVSEALNVRLQDLELLATDPYVRLLGKGNKPRCVPLLDITIENLEYYLDKYHPLRISEDYLFYTVIKGQKDKMSVANTERFIKKYGKEASLVCPQVPKSVHPHLFRHSYGAHLYRMGFSLPVIAKLLDHASLDTTEIYAETDSEMINEAFRTMEESLRSHGNVPATDKKWKTVDEETMAKLYGLM